MSDIRLICCDIADMTPLSNYSDSIEDAMSECSPVKIAKIVIEQHKQISDQEITRLEGELQACKDKWLSPEDTQYLVNRLEQCVEYINDGNHHMAVAKLLADISALKDNE